jgi:aryl-alcohol dehydrogenase-like predicted oxidoreductase
VNDYNILRRYAGDDTGAFAAAQAKNAGVMNAGVFYMGLLSGIDPRESYSMGFKGDLTEEMARTIDIASRQWAWCNERGLNLGALALQWAMKNEAVSTCIVGCRTPEEVNGACDNAAAVVSDEIWTEFAAEFDEEIGLLTEADHWWYVRGETVLS